MTDIPAFEDVPDDEAPMPNYKASRDTPSIKRFFGANDDDEDEPRRRSTRTRARAAKPLPKGGLEKPLTELYTTIGVVIVPFDQVCGTAVVEAAPECAKALNSLAATNPAVRNALISLVTTSEWGKVIIAHLPILSAIAIHHIPSIQGAMGRAFASQVEDEMRDASEPPGRDDSGEGPAPQAGEAA